MGTKAARRTDGRRTPRQAKKTRTKLKAKVHEVIEKAKTPMSVADIAARVDRKPEHIYRVIESLERDGKIVRFKRDGVYHAAPAGTAAPIAEKTTTPDQVRAKLEEIRALGVIELVMRANGSVQVRMAQDYELKIGNGV